MAAIEKAADSVADGVGDWPAGRPGIRAWYTAIILMLTYTLSLLDRKLPFILVESIKHDLSLNDTQIGLLTGVMFALIYSTAAIPIAMLADRRSRKKLIAAAVFLWSSLTALGGFAQNFWQLSATRIGVATGEAACSPAAHSMIADYFKPQYRARAMGLYFVGAQLGLLLGLVLGGWINDIANWRLAMFLLGVPGIVLTLLMIFTIKEPPRIARKGDGEPVPAMEVMRTLFRQPSFVHIMLAAVLFMFTGGGVQAFTPAYFIRTFDMTAAETGLAYGLAAGSAGMIGALVGGLVSDHLSKRAPWKGLVFVAAALFIAGPSLALAFFTENYWLCLFMIFVATACIMSYAGPTFATVQTLVPAKMHAVASAVVLFALSGIGVSLGPLTIGALSDFFAARGAENPLRWALIICVVPMIWGSVHFLIAALKLRGAQSNATHPLVEPAPHSA